MRDTHWLDDKLLFFKDENIVIIIMNIYWIPLLIKNFININGRNWSENLARLPRICQFTRHTNRNWIRIVCWLLTFCFVSRVITCCCKCSKTISTFKNNQKFMHLARPRSGHTIIIERMTGVPGEHNKKLQFYKRKQKYEIRNMQH